MNRKVAHISPFAIKIRPLSQRAKSRGHYEKTLLVCCHSAAGTEIIELKGKQGLCTLAAKQDEGYPASDPNQESWAGTAHSALCHSLISSPEHFEDLIAEY